MLFRVTKQNAIRSIPAKIKRLATDNKGSTVPNWNFMAYQVDPQINEGMVNNMYCRLVNLLKDCNFDDVGREICYIKKNRFLSHSFFEMTAL